MKPATPPASCWRTSRRWSLRTTASCSPSSYRRRWSCSSRTPIPGCRATDPLAAPSRPPWKTGAEIQVPLFLNTGDKIKVDTRDGRYLGRVNA